MIFLSIHRNYIIFLPSNIYIAVSSCIDHVHIIPLSYKLNLIQYKIRKFSDHSIIEAVNCGIIRVGAQNSALREGLECGRKRVQKRLTGRENLVQEGRRQGMQLQREGSRGSLRGLESWAIWARLGSVGRSRRVYKHVQEWGGWLEEMQDWGQKGVL